jgi:hypothetical protein
MADLSPELVRQLVGGSVTDAQVTALAEAYKQLAEGVAAFPARDLKGIEPPLRSTPAPTRP